MTFTLARVEALAPDQASLSAGVKLAKPKAWALIGQDAATGLAWGECQGSASSPYKVILGLYDAEAARVLAGLGAPVFACTPDMFPDMMATALKRGDVSAWAAGRDIKLVAA